MSQWPYSTPHVSPLYNELPYQYRGIRKVSIFCRCEPASMDRFLPPELVRVGDVCEVFVMHVPEAGDLGTYDEAGLVIPVRYGDRVGAHVALEYVTTDDSLCAGREIWGYPKKLCTMNFDETAEQHIHSRVERRGQRLIEAEFRPAQVEFDKPQMQPRLQVKMFARADGKGPDYYQIVHNQLQNFELTHHVTGQANLQLDGNAEDPLHELAVKELVGAEMIVGDFLLSHGTILDDLAKA